jgi:hypothetical protein
LLVVFALNAMNWPGCSTGCRKAGGGCNAPLTIITWTGGVGEALRARARARARDDVQEEMVEHAGGPARVKSGF